MTLTLGQALGELTQCKAALGTIRRALLRAGFRDDQVEGNLGSLIDLLVARANIDREHQDARIEGFRHACEHCGYRKATNLSGGG